MSRLVEGHVRISLNFANLLTSSIYAIVYAKFPDVINRSIVETLL